jgi:hypothetical protein
MCHASFVSNQGDPARRQGASPLPVVLRAAAFAALVVLPAIACGGGTPSSPGSGGAQCSPGSSVSSGGSPPADAGFSRFSRLLLGNTGCLPDTLPELANGMTTCSVFFAGVAAGCGQPGLSPASAEEVAAATAYFMSVSLPVPDGICAFTQVSPVPGCANEAESGWRYAHGACSADAGSTCDQAICTTAGFDADSIAGAQAFFACP